MLVKFLSFVATIFGTARYKAIFLSCLAVVLSITGVTAVAVFKDGVQSKGAASTVGKQNDDSPQQDGSTPQLGGINKQQSTKNVEQTETQDQTASNNQPSSPSAPSTSESSTPTNEVILSANKVTLAAGNTSDTLTASLTDKSNVTWAVVPSTDSDIGIHAIISQNNTGTLSFQLQANQDLQPGTTVRLNVTAHDSNRNLNLSKQITVTIQ